MGMTKHCTGLDCSVFLEMTQGIVWGDILLIFYNGDNNVNCFYSKPMTAVLVQTTGFRMEKVVTMSLKFGKFGTPVKRLV